jgi:ABC-2 type transport system ATP-binding protein
VPLTSRRVLAVLTALATSAALAPLTAPPALAAPQRDVVVKSFDGTPIVVHFFPADGLSKGERAPVVMIAHGYGEKGPATRDEALVGAPSTDALLKSGYNVLTWDARGHGGSGGTAMFDSPDFEVRDTRKLIDWAARQPEVKLDAKGDPRVGMAGASYGGIIQFNTAAADRRVDVISPSYTGHSLSDDMIAPRGKFKETWASFLTVATAQTVPPGVISPAGPQVHTPDPEAISGLLSGAATGELSEEFRAYLDYRSPSRFVGRIRVPTLLQEGTTDLLFPLSNATKNYRTLKANGVPVKMVWNCEGHSLCGRSTGPAGRFTATTIRWFDRHLKGRSASTGRPFEWIADNEDAYRSAVRFPPASAGSLRASGSGQLAVSPLSPLSSTGFIGAGGSPAAYSVNADFSAPPGERSVVGAPKLTISYSGTAAPAAAHLYAQVVDLDANRVVGGQITPIRVTLDGGQHTVTQELEAIATRAKPSSRYQLQILPGSLAFGQQRSTGVVQLHRVKATLPLINPLG